MICGPSHAPVTLERSVHATRRGSSVRMIERHYGALHDGAGAGISGRLDSLEAELEAKTRAAADAERQS